MNKKERASDQEKIKDKKREMIGGVNNEIFK
jgi:hypothetical protein